MWTRFSKTISIATCVLLLLSAMVLLPIEASADSFTDETDTDFSQGTFTNTEIVGTGPPASVRLVRNVANWVDLLPPSNPGEREGPSYCYDEIGSVMVIFGGYAVGVYLNDTWEYDFSTSTWTEIVTGSSPLGREWGAMAYDDDNQVCVLFGGLTSGSVMLDDTWEYDVTTNTWTEIPAFFHPGQMISSAMAFDTGAGRSILVGLDFITSTMQTWAYEASLDVWIFQVEGSPSPAVSGHAVAFDVSIGKTVLFGGIEGGFPPTFHSDTWEYDYFGNTWTFRGTSGPAARHSHAMAYHSSDNAVYLFGGLGASGHLGDTWKRSGSSWSEVVTISRPDPRKSPALVYDSANDYILMCCGQDFSGQYNDTWGLGIFYTFQGFFKSRVFDNGTTLVEYGNLYFNQSSADWPPLTEIRMRLGSSNSPGGPFTCVGWDGKVATWINESGDSIPSFHDYHRYMVYCADLISWDGKYSPSLDNVTITYIPQPGPPYIDQTDPKNADLGVPVDKCIVITFSEAMNTGSVNVQTYYLNPKIPTGITFDWTWSGLDTILTMCPQTNYVESGIVQVWVNGTDQDNGFSLVPHPTDPTVVNPFIFVVSGEPPTIASTNPALMQEDVVLNANVIITWSEPMDTASVTWTINMGFNPGGWSESWNSPTDTVLTLSHAVDFNECDQLEFEVLTGQDVSGKDFLNTGSPNPWWFKTFCFSPYVVSNDPQDGAPNVPVNYPITVTFSESMSTATLVHGISPNVTLTPTWSALDTVLTVNHANFQEGTSYEYCIYDVEDLEGYHLLNAPFCIAFMTESANPYVASTYPEDGATEVDPDVMVMVAFSEEMNTGSVTWTLTPNVPDKAQWQETWLFNQFFELRHTDPMLYCTEYTFEITGGTDPSGNPLIAGLAPNPWSFSTTFEFPCVIDTDPFNGQTMVGLWQEIYVAFDEPINKSSFSHSIGPTLPGTAWTETWSNGDRDVTLNHSKPLPPGVQINVQVSAQDLDGNSLMPGLPPNPFHFFTIFDPDWPWIEQTSPAHMDVFVLTDALIIVQFSETMDTGSVSWLVDDLGGPSSIVFTPSWSQTVYPDDTLTLNHVELLKECQTYWFLIGGQDLLGNQLQAGPVQNPWQFDTICVYPAIMSTNPADQDVNVPLAESIVIDFSEEIQPGTFQWVIVPDQGGWTETWSNGNQTVTLSHSIDFVQCINHDIQVNHAWDLDNNDLVAGPVPNPWSFSTECVNPYIVSSDPYDGEIDVAWDRDVIVVFSEPMDTGSVVFQILPMISFSTAWSANDTILTVSHTDPFLECELYSAGISDGTDIDGNGLIPGPSPVPNPWSFTTLCVPPTIIDTSPQDGEVNVALDVPIIITFSEPMNTVTVSVNVNPSPGGWTQEWSTDETILWMNHSSFGTCEWVTVTVQSGQDKVGLDLVPGPVPNPWSFMTICPNPYILLTDPADGELGVLPLDKDIAIEFNEPMETGTVTWTINPNPGGWTPSWQFSNTLLILGHSNNFLPDTIYLVTVTYGEDPDGYPLIPGPVENPWQFQTGAVAKPQVNWTSPSDLELNVGLMADIVISFTKEMLPGTFHWNFTLGVDPSPGAWTEVWSQWWFPSDTVTLSHPDAFAEETSYCVEVEHARDTLGQDLGGGAYEFCFVTISTLPPPGGLTVTKTGFVSLTWNTVAGATHYNIYDSTDKFAAFPGGWNMNQVADPTNTYDFSHLGDGQDHYYVVRAYDSVSFEISTNSTMGVKIAKALTVSPGQATIYWMSLPFVSEYSSASDITSELTQSNINLVAKWDRTSQDVVSYYYARGKWRGRDFSIGAGDGIYVSPIVGFTWDIVGTDSDATISLPFSGVPTKNNKHWISVPYTGVHTRASDIVWDIEGGTGPGTNMFIVEVGLWDPGSQSERVYYYTPTGWTGDDFLLSPGDGIYLKMVQSYIWSPLLLTPYVP